MEQNPRFDAEKIRKAAPLGTDMNTVMGDLLFMTRTCGNRCHSEEVFANNNSMDDPKYKACLNRCFTDFIMSKRINDEIQRMFE